MTGMENVLAAHGAMASTSDFPAGTHVTCMCDWAYRTQSDHTTHVADAILAAGYRKPRQITTVEELDALPLKSVLLDSDSEAVQRIDDETMDGCSLWETALGLVTSGLVMLPVTVLWEPLP